MGAHSGARKLRSLRRSIQIRNTGRHSDKPILEQEPARFRAASSGKHRAAVSEARRANAVPEPDHRHKRSRLWLSAGLSAAAVAVVIAASILVSTQPDTTPPDGRSPVVIGKTPDGAESVPESVPTEPHTSDPSEPATALPVSPETNGQAPAAVPTVTVSGPAPAPVRPSGQAPAAPGPTVTRTETVTQRAAPGPTATVTVLKTVRATETRYLPGPRVTVRVTVSVPSLLP